MPKKQEIIEYLLSHNINYNQCISFLKNDCKIKKGFEAQIVGIEIPSATTTGLITYILSKLGELNNSEKDMLKEEILSFRITETGSFIDKNDGLYDTLTFGTQSYVSVWATSQSMLGLISLGNVTKKELDKTARWLIKVQKEGGWSFSGNENENNQLIYSIYPIIGLTKYYNYYHDTSIFSALEKSLQYAINNKTNNELDKIIKIWIIKYLSKFLGVDSDIQNVFKIDFFKIIDKEFSNSIIYEHSVSPFSMQYFTPSFYLLLRDVIAPDHPFCSYIIKYLITNQINGNAWAHVAQARINQPYSFCTALSIYCLYLWAFDSLKKSKIIKRLPSFNNLIHKIKNISYKPPKIFLSYSKIDIKVAKKIANSLKLRGYNVWYDEWEIKVGDSIIEKINNGIEESNFLLILLSKNSVNSRWVKEELSAAKIKEIDKRKVFILPILLNECTIPPLISDKRYADIRTSYQRGIEEILDALGDFYE